MRRPARRQGLVLPSVCVVLLATAGCGPGREIRELVQRGDEFRSEGRPRRSLAAYEAALALDPEHVPAHLGIGILHASQGQPAQAIARYCQILELDPSSATAHTEWARALLQQGRAPDAAREAAEASRIDPSSADALRVHGIAYARTDQLERAIEKFQQADALDPDPTADVLVAWGRALRNLGRTREARAKLEGALSSDLDDGEAAYLLGSCLLEVDAERGRGIRLLERALRIDPSNPEYLGELAGAYLRTRRFAEAADLAQRALGATPAGDPAHGVLRRRLAAARARLTPGSAPADAPNVLLVVIDTLRADHLGTHGYRRNTSPNLDRLAGEGTLFENAISQAPWTAPSIATLFTGLYPSVHGLDEGVRWGRDQRAAGASLEFGIQKVLGASQVTLAEVLRSHGYRTAGFVSAVFVNSIFGFAQGFQVYDDEHADYSGDYFRTKRRAEETNRRVFAWLGQELEEPFFLFVHYIDPHWPYDPPHPHGASYVADYQGRLTPGDTAFVVESGGAPITGVDAADLRYLIGLYDGEIHYVDAQLAALLERVRATPTERGLLTVVTADHGEEFLDHGSGSHGYTLFEEQVHVPLLLHLPGRIPSRRIQGPVGLVDVMPTILELVGLPGRPGLSQGESLLPLIDGRMTVSARVEYSEATYGGALRALQTSEGMKLIHSATHEGALLFSLLDDPGEQRHLGAEMSELADGLAERIERWSRANRLARLEVHGPGDAEEVELDSDIQERLRALGYIR